MEASSSSSSSSSPSIGSTDDFTIKITSFAVKFQCSYDGRILPRHSDGKLRYVGGHTRVLSVNRFVSYTELQAKLAELCGWGSAVCLRCQLPNDNLDALISVTSDEDLANLFEEYELAKLLPMKIRAFLHPQGSKTTKTPTHPPSNSTILMAAAKRYQVYQRCLHQFSDPSRFQFNPGGDAWNMDHESSCQNQYLICHWNRQNQYLIYHWNRQR